MIGGRQSVLIPLSDISAPSAPGGRPAVAVAKPGSHPGFAGRSSDCDFAPDCECSSACDLNFTAPSAPGGRPAVAVAKPGSHPGFAGRSSDCDFAPDCECAQKCPALPPGSGLLAARLWPRFRAALARSSAPGACCFWDCGLLGDCGLFLFFEVCFLFFCKKKHSSLFFMKKTAFFALLFVSDSAPGNAGRLFFLSEF